MAKANEFPEFDPATLDALIGDAKSPEDFVGQLAADGVRLDFSPDCADSNLVIHVKLWGDSIVGEWCRTAFAWSGGLPHGTLRVARARRASAT